MTHCGKFPVHSKTVDECKVFGQISNFNYDISLEIDKDVEYKINKLQTYEKYKQNPEKQWRVETQLIFLKRRLRCLCDVKTGLQSEEMEQYTIGYLSMHKEDVYK